MMADDDRSISGTDDLSGPSTLPVQADDIADAELMPLMTKAWLNERFAPEILPFAATVFTRLRQLVEAQNEQLASEKTDNVNLAFLSHIFTMEIERIKYVLRAYLRIRLEKIHRFYLLIAISAETQRLLSPDEIKYAKRYHDIVKRHMEESVLSHLPESFQQLHDPKSREDMVVKPNINKSVFARVIDDIGPFQVDPTSDEILDLKKGSLYLIRYLALKPFLLEGTVDLV